MPILRIRSMSQQAVQNLSQKLPQSLSVIMSTSIDNFTVERIGSEVYSGGQRIQGDPMIEVLWFDRGEKVQGSSALEITKLVRQEVGQSGDVTVIFTVLDPACYYENGKNFA